jgi:ABC-2 type transport system permease protein
VITIGLGAMFCFAKAQHFGQLPLNVQQAQRAAEISQATEVSLFGLILGQLVIAVLGALTITSEYSTGMIRTSLSVMPRRGVWLGAKATVFGMVALVTGLVTSFVSYFLGQAILSTQHINSTLGQPGVLRAVVGGGLFLAVCGLLSFGLGALLRHTAGAITASIALLFVLFVLTGFLPESWANDIDKWLPFNAGSAIWQHASASSLFSPWTGFGLFCGYAAIALAGGLILFRRRDA